LVLELVGPSSVVLTVVLQAEAREKERVKEESKRLKKLELNFKNLLRDLNVDYELSWDEVKPKLENEEEYLAFSSESDRIKIYKVRDGIVIVSVVTVTIAGLSTRNGRIV
jgi:hypothetical protein